MSALLPENRESKTVPVRRGTALSDSPPSTFPAAEVETPPVEAEVPCPRCGTKLVNPSSLGWCMKCGYCKTIEEEKNNLPAAPTVKKPSALGILEFFQLFGKIPGWGWVLIIGCLVVLCISLAANEYLWLNSFERALWQAIQIAVGLLAILVGRIWAIMLVASEEETVSVKDVFFSWHLWKLTIKRLPETRRPVWIGAWGLTAFMCANSIIGGQEYWYQYYKPKKYASKNLMDVVSSMAQGQGEEMTMEEAMKKMEQMAKDKLNMKKKQDDKIDRRPTVECVIFGYTIDPVTKELNGLLIATLKDGNLAYAGICRRGWTPEAKKEMLKLFASRVRETPFIPGLKVDATWLRPELYCEVHQSGWDTDGMLMQPTFKTLLQRQALRR